jgi:branched-chain amino acid transport system ATP-binding protein
MTALLEVRGLTRNYGNLKAVAGVSFTVPDGAIVALIGPNGAGKTTTFNLIAGTMAPDAGEVILAGRRLSGLRPDEVCAAGIGRTFQIVKPFAGLTVEENVLVGALLRYHRVEPARAKARGVLDLLGLLPLARQTAGSLTLPRRWRPSRGCSFSMKSWLGCGPRRPTAWWVCCVTSTVVRDSQSC